MRGSLRIGAVAGTGIYIHWTFSLLLLWVAYITFWVQEGAFADALRLLILILAVFGCVILHELGHALMARRFGIATRAITVLPIGGIASLDRMPEEPNRELLIAIAGPAVNVVIAAVLYATLVVTGDPPPPRTPAITIADLGFIPALLTINIILVLFNLLPAFPMDGGRMLRALLAYRLDYIHATRIAARIGQAMALLFAFAALFIVASPILLLIAVFVFLAAQAEASAAETRSAFHGVPVRDAMVTRFRVLSQDATLADASSELLAGAQQDFPVVDNGRIVGLLPRAQLVQALAAHGLAARVSEAMIRGCEAADESESLFKVFERMQRSGCPLVPVMRAGELVGLVTPDNVGELLMLRSALRQSIGAAAPAGVMRDPRAAGIGRARRPAPEPRP